MLPTNGDDITGLVLSLAQQDALKEQHKKETKRALSEELHLLEIAIKNLVVTHLTSGPYIETALAKIDLCREILRINEEKIPEKLQTQIDKKFILMKRIINRKIRYGRLVDRYLEKKEGSIIEQLKEALLPEEMADYEKIREKLLNFQTVLEKRVKDIKKKVDKLN